VKFGQIGSKSGDSLTADWLNTIACLSPWTIGLITLATWSAVSLITYVLIVDRSKNEGGPRVCTDSLMGWTQPINESLQTAGRNPRPARLGFLPPEKLEALGVPPMKVLGVTTVSAPIEPAAEP